MNVVIRQAQTCEHTVLTDISFAAKGYWNYPEAYLDIWKNELTITPAYIESNLVYVAETEAEITGYMSVVEVKRDFWAGKVFVKKGYWLEHIFIKPPYIGQGIGSELIDFLKNLCRAKQITKLYIFSDPYAKGFYDKIGARYIEESPSSIKGRTVSLYLLEIENNNLPLVGV